MDTNCAASHPIIDVVTTGPGHYQASLTPPLLVLGRQVGVVDRQVVVDLDVLAIQLPGSRVEVVGRVPRARHHHLGRQRHALGLPRRYYVSMSTPWHCLRRHCMQSTRQCINESTLDYWTVSKGASKATHHADQTCCCLFGPGQAGNWTELYVWEQISWHHISQPKSCRTATAQHTMLCIENTQWCAQVKTTSWTQLHLLSGIFWLHAHSR